MTEEINENVGCASAQRPQEGEEIGGIKWEMRTELSHRDSQLYFSELQTTIIANIQGLEKITILTAGEAYLYPYRNGIFLNKKNNNYYEIEKYGWLIREKIKEEAIKQRKKNLEINFEQFFNKHIKDEIEKEKREEEERRRKIKEKEQIIEMLKEKGFIAIDHGDKILARFGNYEREIGTKEEAEKLSPHEAYKINIEQLKRENRQLRKMIEFILRDDEIREKIEEEIKIFEKMLDY